MRVSQLVKRVIRRATGFRIETVLMEYGCSLGIEDIQSQKVLNVMPVKRFPLFSVGGGFTFEFIPSLNMGYFMDECDQKLYRLKIIVHADSVRCAAVCWAKITQLAFSWRCNSELSFRCYQLVGAKGCSSFWKIRGQPLAQLFHHAVAVCLIVRTCVLGSDQE